MDAATLQARIYAGYAKAASRIGYLNDHYRPASAFNPLAVGNKLAQIYASYNAEDMGYKKPNKYGHPTWWGLFDGTLTQVGDYLVDPVNGTFFIAAQQQALPILCVSCNRTISVMRVSQRDVVGAINYGGDTPTNEQIIMGAWPASVLIGGRSKRNEVGLPGDVDSAGWQVLLPAVAGVTIKPRDILTDETNARYIVNSNELTDLGWRIQATQALA